MKENKFLKYQLFSSILISLGPILWLFINIYDKNYKILPINIALAIIGVGVILFNFKIYLKNYKTSNSKIIDLFFNRNKRNKYRWIDKLMLSSMIVLTYIIITSVTVVTEDGIYDYSFYNLKGNKYEFS
ncbi:hypothetical protein H9L25_05870 [Terrisporobacter mayombei]|nr:hypothetical protein [Terrisporobacter mayombei]